MSSRRFGGNSSKAQKSASGGNANKHAIEKAQTTSYGEISPKDQQSVVVVVVDVVVVVLAVVCLQAL